MSGGTFMVARSVWDHDAFKAEPFSEREAFLWLISEAAWRARTTRVGSYVVQVERGQLCHSTRFIASAWKWTPARVFRFLGRLADFGMIEKRNSSETAPCVITICNYEKFQTARNSGNAEAEQQRNSSETNENKGNKGNKKEDNPPTPRKRVVCVDPPGFSEFWEAYPRKLAKGAARKAWVTATRTTDPPSIIAAARRVEDRGQYTPHPATWLNAERWADQEQSHGQRGQNRTGSPLFDAAMRVAERERASGGTSDSCAEDDPGEPRMAWGAGSGVVVSLLATGRAASYG